MMLLCFALIVASLHLIWRELRRLGRAAHVSPPPLQVAASPRERFNQAQAHYRATMTRETYQALIDAEEALFEAVR